MIFITRFITLIVCITSLNAVSNNKVLVIGGSGRVGGSAVRSLLSQGYSVDVGGRNIDNWNIYKCRFTNKETNNAQFISMDALSKSSLQNIIPNYDLIINTAGPFQGLKENIALECCLNNGKNYIDVCDDIELSRICRSKYYQDIASKTGSIAIISAGIWPGGSSLLAQELILDLQDTKSSELLIKKEKETVNKITFSFFTAGSGGAGETILTATFLLLGENVLTYINGEMVYEKPASNSQLIDFGNIVGRREVVRLNLIECESCYQSSKIPNIETYFGTAPTVWNLLFIAMARLTPQTILQNRVLMRNLAKLSLPMVRLVDMFVGSNNGIRVDAYSSSRRLLGTSVMVHDDLEAGVGHSIAAFAIPFLGKSSSSSSTTTTTISNSNNNGNSNTDQTTLSSSSSSSLQSVQQQIDENAQSTKSFIHPGVYFPEEIPNDTYRKQVLKEIKRTAVECYTLLF